MSWKGIIYRELDAMLEKRAEVDYGYAMNALRTKRNREGPLYGPWSFNPSIATMRRWVLRWLNERNVSK